jgi:hypothetical protein
VYNYEEKITGSPEKRRQTKWLAGFCCCSSAFSFAPINVEAMRRRAKSKLVMKTSPRRCVSLTEKQMTKQSHKREARQLENWTRSSSQGYFNLRRNSSSSSSIERQFPGIIADLASQWKLTFRI